MMIVIDTNVLLSALIKDSFTRRIIIFSGFDFVYPESSMKELKKYEKLTLKKSKLTKTEYNKILELLFKNIVLVSEEDVKINLKNAKRIMNKIDPKDTVFVATALIYPNTIIWSDDKDFDKQNKIKVIKTAQFMELLFKK